ncbi:D-aminoacyl-tRNA deacylase [Deinococcus yavapaiensis]|uniref:D-aminoacyl-tRNA deacylase n=1 Tax=Deinococcus yavapaiensis KR-236 TaxID=694435 RepID=A0A318S992_9DEIO|nr:D-aminoacyl-tRNA deacylase [Deinococcus yavapaiensis]PYE55285.1 D-tyrosyl-tRNA(Tyr) deacylase [Deinococcus yavapaiensis KR-236]
MRALVQRVTRASVTVDGTVVGQIAGGLLVLLGVGHDDTVDTARKMAEKLAKMRVFADDAGKMNRSVLDVGGAVLSVSQFTLYGDARGGNRPSFTASAPAPRGQVLYEAFNDALRALNLCVEVGVFGAHMAVELVNDGPVTLMVEL